MAKEDENEKAQRVDDALLHALSLVLSANGEYARSVSALLEADLERDASLSEVRDLVKDLVKDTQTLIKSQDELKTLLSGFSQQYSTLLTSALKDVVEDQKQYFDAKFTGLFRASGLKDDGTDYNPTDKLVVKFRSVLFQMVWMLLSGGALYYLAGMIIKKMGGM